MWVLDYSSCYFIFFLRASVLFSSFFLQFFCIGLNDMCTTPLVKSCLFSLSLFSLSSLSYPLQGLILIMAPRRGRTLDAFLELCQGKFDIYLDEEFDGDVTLSHQKVITVTKIFPRARSSSLPLLFCIHTDIFFLKIRRVIYILYIYIYICFCFCFICSTEVA